MTRFARRRSAREPSRGLTRDCGNASCRPAIIENSLELHWAGRRKPSFFPGRDRSRSAWARRSAEAFPQARAVFDEVDAALGAELIGADVRGPAGRTDVDRQCAAGADGGEPRGGARARSRSRARPRARRQIRRRPFARRIFGARGRRRVERRRRREAAAPARAGDAGGGAGRRRRDGGAARARCRGGPRCRAARGRGRPAASAQVANDNGGGQVVVSGREGRREPRHRNRQGEGRAPRRAAAGVGAVPLRPDAARRRSDGRGARQGRHPAAVVPLVANVLRGADRAIRPRSASFWSPSHRHRCVGARCMVFMAEQRRYDISSNVAPAKFCRASSSGSRRRASGISIGTPEDIALYQALA